MQRIMILESILCVIDIIMRSVQPDSDLEKDSLYCKLSWQMSSAEVSIRDVDGASKVTREFLFGWALSSPYEREIFIDVPYCRRDHGFPPKVLCTISAAKFH